MGQVVLINIMNLYWNSNIKLVFSVRLIIIISIFLIFIYTLNAQQTSQPRIILKTISVEETAGQNRQFEPVEILFNFRNHESVNPEKQISIVEILDDGNEKEILQDFGPIWGMNHLRMKLNPKEPPGGIRHCRHRAVFAFGQDRKTLRHVIDPISMAHPDHFSIIFFKAMEQVSVILIRISALPYSRSTALDTSPLSTWVRYCIP